MIKPSISSVCFLCVFALISASCSWMSTGRITPQPEDFQIPSNTEKSARIYFDFHSSRNGHTIDIFRRGLEDNPTFKEAVYISELPKQGVSCNITFFNEPRSPFIFAWAIFSGLSMGIIPFYDAHGDRHTFIYELYVDGDLKNSYQYLITMKALWWIGAPLLKPFLPRDWTGTVDSENYDKAVIGTARAFWLDAHKDGFL
jgi:hypothetical protein